MYMPKAQHTQLSNYFKSSIGKDLTEHSIEQHVLDTSSIRLILEGIITFSNEL